MCFFNLFCDFIDVIVVVVGTGRDTLSYAAEYQIALLLCFSERINFLLCSLFLVAFPSVSFETWFGCVMN
jgi:hypothetical protein